jgi:hypothetical protein
MARDPPRVELFLRSLAPARGREQQERIVERLHALDDEGLLRGFEVVLCGDCVCPRAATASTEPGRRLLDRYEAFDAWAERTGRELTGFEVRDTRSILTGTTTTGVVFPRVVLAEYRDGELAFVAPSRDAEVTSVPDRLSTYESRATPVCRSDDDLPGGSVEETRE